MPDTSGTDRWHACAIGDLPPGSSRQVDLDGRAVALFNLDGEIIALDGRCRHRGGRLGDGLVRDGIVACPLHWWRYEIRSGQLVGAPRVRIDRYPVAISNGHVWVDLPPPEAEEPIRQRLLRRAREWAAARDAGWDPSVGEDAR